MRFYDVPTNLFDPATMELYAVDTSKPCVKPRSLVCVDCGRVMRPWVAIRSVALGGRYIYRCQPCFDTYIADLDARARTNE